MTIETDDTTERLKAPTVPSWKPPLLSLILGNSFYWSNSSLWHLPTKKGRINNKKPKMKLTKISTRKIKVDPFQKNEEKANQQQKTKIKFKKWNTMKKLNPLEKINEKSTSATINPK